jgi:hypothetical protein
MSFVLSKLVPNKVTRGQITQDDPYQYACVSNLGALLLHVPHGTGSIRYMGTVPRAARKAKNSR